MKLREVVGWVGFERDLTCNSAQQQRNWQWRFEMGACPFSTMVHLVHFLAKLTYIYIHIYLGNPGCYSEVETSPQRA